MIKTGFGTVTSAYVTNTITIIIIKYTVLKYTISRIQPFYELGKHLQINGKGF